MKPSVLIVCSEAPPQIGGIASLLEVFCRELLRRGDHQVHLLARPGAAQDLADTVFDELAWPTRALHNLPLSLRNAATFRRLSSRHAYQRVIFFDAAARLYGLPLAPRVPACVLVHGTELRVASRTSEWQSRRHFLQQRAMRRVDQVFATSRAVAELATTAVPSVVPQIVHPAYDARRTYDPALHTRSPYAAAPGAFILLTVSRLTERKGHESVLRLLSRVRHVLPHVHYFIVGDGPHRAALEALVHALELTARVTFVGAVPTQELGGYYHFADLFIMLSHASREGVEGFGLTYVEAAVSGTPSIASRHGGAVEAVQDGVTGVTIEPTELEAAAQALVSLVQDQARRERYAQAGRAWAQDALSPARFVQRLLGDEAPAVN